MAYGRRLAHEAGLWLAAIILKGAFTANPGKWVHGIFDPSGIVVCSLQHVLCNKRCDSCMYRRHSRYLKISSIDSYLHVGKCVGDTIPWHDTDSQKMADITECCRPVGSTFTTCRQQTKMSVIWASMELGVDSRCSPSCILNPWVPPAGSSCSRSWLAREAFLSPKKASWKNSGRRFLDPLQCVAWYLCWEQNLGSCTWWTWLLHGRSTIEPMEVVNRRNLPTASATLGRWAWFC